ncbi:hypothetical protein MTO96_007709 [Rhipicephalus appendiculatus]
MWNSKLDSKVLKRLKHAVQRIRPDIADNWKLHHNNATAHSAFKIADYMVKAGVPVIPKSPNRPGLAPPEFPFSIQP